MVRGEPDSFPIPILISHQPAVERVIFTPGQVYLEEVVEFSSHRPAPGGRTRGHPRTGHAFIQLKLPLGPYLSDYRDGCVPEGLNTGV